MEWEKAARGVDGRAFPWGWSWEPGFAATAAVWSGATPPPIGHIADDISPYGARDFAGGVREWTSTAAPGRGARFFVRGGSYRWGYEFGRPLWERETINATHSAHDLGFRLALDINLLPTPDGVEGGE
jgi:formylglycine-generating enzyme required for sulfatase activity